MVEHPVVPAPVGTVRAEEFYEADTRRATSRDLSYGSGWKVAGWSDQTHVVELYWLGATHELVAFYVAYDWSRVDPDDMKISAAEALGEAGGSGLEIGHVLRVQDEAAAGTFVEVLANLSSDLECHEVMWGWHWLQHHPDGLTHIRSRIARRVSDGPGAAAAPGQE